MKRVKAKSDNTHWFLFLLFPFVACIKAFKNYKISWAKNIVWAFVVFYGFTLGTSKEGADTGGTADIFRYVEEVQELYKKDLNLEQIATLYQENEDYDILKLTLAIVISRFTDSMQILAAVYGFIFGFFFSRNIWYVLDRLKGKLKPIIILLLTGYCLVNPIWNLNGFRFNTAAHIFIYGLLPFLFEGKKKGFWISALSILVHFSFLLPVTVLLVYRLLGNRTVVYFVFFLASIVTSEINITELNTSIKENTSEDFSKRTSSYTDEERVQEYRQDGNIGIDIEISWHARVYLKALHWSLMMLLIFLFFKRERLELVNKRFLSCFSFTLLIWGVANVMSSLPSGGRFLAVAALSAMPLLIFYIQNRPEEKYLSNKVLIATPALLLFIIVAVRVGFYSLSVNTLIGNPFVVIFTDYNWVLNDLIK